MQKRYISTIKTKKKKFQGNQFTNESGEALGESTSAQKLATASAEDVPVKLAHFL